MTEKGLGGEDNKRLAEWKTDLASGNKFEIESLISKMFSHLRRWK